MRVKEEIHSLVDRLPERDLHSARRFLEYLLTSGQPSVLEVLNRAPNDDEAETPEEVAAVERAWQQSKRGETVSDEELWKRLGHEPRH